MTVVRIRSGYWTDKYVGYAADRSSYEVSTRDDPGLSRNFQIDDQKDDRYARQIWTIHAWDTQRPNRPPGARPDYYMDWAYAPLVLIAPPGEAVRLGGVGYQRYPIQVGQWVAHPAPDGGGYYTLEAMTQPGNYLTHGLNNWLPDNSLPLGLCAQSATNVPPQDFRWYLETVPTPGAEALKAAAET
jgi:hypothetical protein